MTKFTPKLAAGIAAAVALATAFTSAHAQQLTPLYAGGGTLAEKVYRDIYNQYGSTASQDTCSLSSNTGGGTLLSKFCASTPYNANVEVLYAGVGSGNGKKALDSYSPSLYVSGPKKPDNPPVPSTRDFGPFYGLGTGPNWTPYTGATPNNVVNPYPKVTFSGSDDPLNSSDIATYNALTIKNVATNFGPLIQFPGLVVAVAIPFNPSGTSAHPWNPQGKLLSGGSSKVDLSTNTICGIFTGAITDWSDPSITKDNRGKQLGIGPITVVYRHDGSGTTFLMSNALLNQCGTTEPGAPVQSLHSIPAAWLTAAVQGGTAITYSPTTTPTAGHYYSNDNFFINVYNASLLPSNFYNDNGGFSGVTGGANGSAGVQQVVDATTGAVGYISPDFVQPITTGSDAKGNPLAAAANIQTYASFSAGTTAVYVPPAAKYGNFIMLSAVPPAFTGSPVPADNPLNWGEVNPTPSSASAYPIGGFTFIDLYSCYADQATVNALVNVPSAKNADKLYGLFSWYYGTTTVNGGIPATTLADNGFSPVPVAWGAAIKKLLLTNVATKVGVANQPKTACASVADGA